jgi:hypothetical protein
LKTGVKPQFEIANANANANVGVSPGCGVYTMECNLATAKTIQKSLFFSSYVKLPK